MDQDYQSITCIQHERLEFSVLRRIPLAIVYQLNGMSITEKILPLDVYTRDKAEWLKFRREDGNVEEIRLDWISSFDEVLT